MSHDDMGNRIFIGGLDVETTESVLEEAFQMFGDISQVLLMRHRETNVPRGFAFISFMDPSSAHEAISRMHGVEILGKCVTVRKAEKQGSVTERPTRRGGFRGRGMDRGRSNRFENDRRRPYDNNMDEQRSFDDPRPRYNDSGYSRGGYQGSRDNRESGGYQRNRKNWDEHQSSRDSSARGGFSRDDSRRRGGYDNHRENRPKGYERDNARESYSRRDTDMMERPGSNFENSRSRGVDNEFQSSRSFRNPEMESERSNDRRNYRERGQRVEVENNERKPYRERNRSNDFGSSEIRGAEFMNSRSGASSSRYQDSDQFGAENKRFSSRTGYAQERSRSPIERYSIRDSSPPTRSRYHSSKPVVPDSPPVHFMREKREHQPENRRSNRDSSRNVHSSYREVESSPPPPSRRMNRRSPPEQFASSGFEAMIRNSSSSPKRVSRDGRNPGRSSRMHVRSEQIARNVSPDIATSHRSREAHPRMSRDRSEVVAFENIERSAPGSHGYSERSEYQNNGKASRFATSGQYFNPPSRGISEHFSSSHESKRPRRQISPTEPTGRRMY